MFVGGDIDTVFQGTNSMWWPAFTEQDLRGLLQVLVGNYVGYIVSGHRGLDDTAMYKTGLGSQRLKVLPSSIAEATI